MSNPISSLGPSGTGAAGAFGQIPQGGSGPAGNAGQATGTGATTGTGAATGTGATTGSAGAAQSGSLANSAQNLAGTDTFLKILVAQLQHQDPTSPMDDSAFVTELAQFNTVEQMINLKDQIAAQVSAQQTAEGVALLGKTVTYKVPSVTGGQSTTSQGQVRGVNLAGGAVQLQIGAQQISLGNVISVDG